jgi:hypothetical protein
LRCSTCQAERQALASPGVDGLWKLVEQRRVEGEDDHRRKVGQDERLVGSHEEPVGQGEDPEAHDACEARSHRLLTFFSLPVGRGLN